jgi:hypothetical protein
MVKSKQEPVTTTPKKDYSDPTGILLVWNSITELGERLEKLREQIKQWTPDDDNYYDVSKELTKLSQEYVNYIFDLWRYARETGAKHSKGEKVEFGNYVGEVIELIPVFDEVAKFLKWDYSVMYKNEAGETDFTQLLSAIPQGNTAVLDSVIVDDQPVEPEAIAPEPEPEQLSLLPNELPRDLGNDYLGFKANQLIDILNSFPREAIAVTNYFRTGGKSDPEIIIETNRGGLAMWMGNCLLEIDSGEIESAFDKRDCTIEKPWEDYLDDHLIEIGFHREKENDLIKLEKPILDRPYEYQDMGDGRYKVFTEPSPNKNDGQRFLGMIWQDNDGWVSNDLLPAENSRRAIAYRLHQKRKERENEGKEKVRQLVAKVGQATAKKTKAITESKSTVTTGKKPIIESKPAGKKSKPVTELKSPAKNSKPASKKTDGAIAKKSKSIHELKPAPTNSVTATNGKPQGCINWSAPAGGAKVPAGTKYPYYCYHEGGKLRRCYIGGGNQQATIAQSRVRAVEEAIAQSKSPDEIVNLIHELKRG